MSLTPAFCSHLAVQGAALHARVLSRDDGHLAPERLSAAAAGRMRAGIAALESWLRRVLLLMALAMEPDIAPAPRPWVKIRCRRLRRPWRGLRVFTGHGGLPSRDPFAALARRRAGRYRPGGRHPVPAAPLLARLAQLRALVDAPEARARRLAFHIARRRPGPLMAPRYRGPASGRLFGTEAGALHDGLGAAITERSRARPPPLGPAIRAGPRLRQL